MFSKSSLVSTLALAGLLSGCASVTDTPPPHVPPMSVYQLRQEAGVFGRAEFLCTFQPDGKITDLKLVSSSSPEMAKLTEMHILQYSLPSSWANHVRGPRRMRAVMVKAPNQSPDLSFTGADQPETTHPRTFTTRPERNGGAPAGRAVLLCSFNPSGDPVDVTVLESTSEQLTPFAIQALERAPHGSQPKPVGTQFRVTYISDGSGQTLRMAPDKNTNPSSGPVSPMQGL